jgi:hypothetical protein
MSPVVFLHQPLEFVIGGFFPTAMANDQNGGVV